MVFNSMAEEELIAGRHKGGADAEVSLELREQRRAMPAMLAHEVKLRQQRAVVDGEVAGIVTVDPDAIEHGLHDVVFEEGIDRRRQRRLV